MAEEKEVIMANPIIIQPDAELALIQYLRGVSAVTAVVAADHITTTMPPTPDFTVPRVLVQRIGGSSLTWQSIDEPAYQVDVVGGSRFDCQKVMRTVRGAVMAIANDTVSAGVLASAEEEIGPIWMPDNVPVPPVPRYTWRCRVFIHN